MCVICPRLLCGFEMEKHHKAEFGFACDVNPLRASGAEPHSRVWPSFAALSPVSIKGVTSALHGHACKTIAYGG